MTNPYPLPRETRESAPFAGDGRATYGPFDFRIWDVDDVVAEVSRGYAEYTLEAVRATKVANQPFDDFSVTFDPPLGGEDVAIVSSRRLQERLGDVTRGQSISSAALERELSIVGTVLQELRRDLDKGGTGNVGGGGGGVITIGDVAGLAGVLATKASVTAVQALSATIATIAARTVLGGGLAAAATVGAVTTISVAAATQAEAEAGLNNTAVMTPLRVAQAIAAIGGGSGGTDPADAAMVARVPAIFDKSNDMTLSKLFAREGVATLDVRAQKLVSTQSPWNSDYAGGNIASFHVRHVAEGTEMNGPRGAALGIGISMFKEGFGTGTARPGEIDGLYIVLRQDSPRNANSQTSADKADGCGVLIDAAVFDKVGFVGGIEGNTSVINDNGIGTKRRLVYQLGCTDTAVGGASMGVFTSAAQGQHNAGVMVYNAEADGGYFDNMIYCANNAGQIFGVDRRGLVSFGKLTNAGQHINPSMHMTLQADYSLGWLNAAKSVQILSLDQNGNLNAYGNLNGVSVNATGNMQAAGTVIANAGLRAPDLVMTPGARDSTNLSTYRRGQLFVGQGGRLRYCEADGTQPKFVYTTNS
ncbi:hypothetical protein D3218_00385 [Aureimonas flava]|uniref:Uncharacterized protein n=1 Tax=Aureimonas flava TaxID=2320271 RepID=A0A3A1WMZ5_9HYPH|nr:hypothetical protein [Aureimonas flava]RIY03268.1 hypothetical protein D3218_00385 [Aureimonas flava]